MSTVSNFFSSIFSYIGSAFGWAWDNTLGIIYNYYFKSNSSVEEGVNQSLDLNDSNTIGNINNDSDFDILIPRAFFDSQNNESDDSDINKSESKIISEESKDYVIDIKPLVEDSRSPEQALSDLLIDLMNNVNTKNNNSLSSGQYNNENQINDLLNFSNEANALDINALQAIDKGVDLHNNNSYQFNIKFEN